MALGSLDLLDPQGKLGMFAITAKFAEGMGETEKETWTSLAHASYDLVIMNPPYTRSTGHEGAAIGVPRPMFGAFGSDEKEQKLMAKAMAVLTKGTSAHGNAGEASAFLVLGHRKLKPGGVLGLVMPLSLVSGVAWERSRVLLTKYYRKIMVISIAGSKDADVSFSADTGSGECLLIASKAIGNGNRDGGRATFVILKERPSYPMMGAETARQIRRLMCGADLRALEDGPIGGTPIVLGNETVGQVIESPLPPSGGWYLSRIADLSLAQTAHQLENSRLWLPTMSEENAIKIPMAAVQAIGKVGPHHRDIEAGPPPTIRGPFTRAELRRAAAPTYPLLWSHDAERERTMVFDPDCEGIPIKGKAAERQKIHCGQDT